MSIGQAANPTNINLEPSNKDDVTARLERWLQEKLEIEKHLQHDPVLVVGCLTPDYTQGIGKEVLEFFSKHQAVQNLPDDRKELLARTLAEKLDVPGEIVALALGLTQHQEDSWPGDVEEEAKEDRDLWALAKPAPEFLAEEEKEFEGLVKDILASGAITLIAAPKGIGKTQVIYSMVVALTMGGVFRGEQLRPVRVLLVDRDNSRSVIKKRLRAWGAEVAQNLYVLTRENAPSLKDKKDWECLSPEDYDVVIIDSVGSSTEGITEKEGKQTTQVLATIKDLAAKGFAVLLLQNTTKDALSYKGREEWADRVDILYEVRDATGFTPSGKRRPWWQELPEAGASAWAERAARRKGRIDYRLAFISAKFRLGQEPEPFCLEIYLPNDEPWTLRDVTQEIVGAGEEAVARAERAKAEGLEEAAEALAKAVSERAAKGNPILKTEAEIFLCDEQGLRQKEARQLITDKKLWQIQKVPGKGGPLALYPIGEVGSRDDPTTKIPDNEKAVQTQVPDQPISVTQASCERQKSTHLKGTTGADFRDPPFSSSEEEKQQTQDNWGEI